jgi:hypothetical protein
LREHQSAQIFKLHSGFEVRILELIQFKNLCWDTQESASLMSSAAPYELPTSKQNDAISNAATGSLHEKDELRLFNLSTNFTQISVYPASPQTSLKSAYLISPPTCTEIYISKFSTNLYTNLHIQFLHKLVHKSAKV